jgi:hypothetical protein
MVLHHRCATFSEVVLPVIRFAASTLNIHGPGSSFQQDAIVCLHGQRLSQVERRSLRSQVSPMPCNAAQVVSVCGGTLANLRQQSRSSLARRDCSSADAAFENPVSMGGPLLFVRVLIVVAFQCGKLRENQPGQTTCYSRLNRLSPLSLHRLPPLSIHPFQHSVEYREERGNEPVTECHDREC